MVCVHRAARLLCLLQLFAVGVAFRLLGTTPLSIKTQQQHAVGKLPLRQLGPGPVYAGAAPSPTGTAADRRRLQTALERTRNSLMVPVSSLLVGWGLKLFVRRWIKVQAGAKFIAAGGWTGIYATIPLLAGVVNMLTNQLAVWMIFQPLDFWGKEIFKRPEGQPFGLFGWQGIVPSKVRKMGNDVTDTLLSLVDLRVVMSRLDSSILAGALLPGMLSVCDSKIRQLVQPIYGVKPNSGVYSWQGIYRDLVASKLKGCLVRIIQRLQQNPGEFVDLKHQIVGNLMQDKRIIVDLFKLCGREELRFIVKTGLWGGGLLGLVQMALWLVYPAAWSLVLGGALVGYLTDWFALKILFEPVEPMDIFGFRLQGLFLTRQKEVSAEFSKFVQNKLLTPAQLWAALATGPRKGVLKSAVEEELRKELSFALPVAEEDWSDFAEALMQALPTAARPTHDYMQREMRLEETVNQQMLALPSAKFERVLHPIFQEDELTLILVGTVLGALSGGIQVPFY